MRGFVRVALIGLCATAMGSCGNGGVPGPFIAAAPLSPAAVIVRPQALSFYAVGAAYAQTIATSQSNYTGTFTVTTHTCNGIATISGGAQNVYTVTPAAAGRCTFAVAGGNSQTAIVTIDVTNTSIGGS